MLEAEVAKDWLFCVGCFDDAVWDWARIVEDAHVGGDGRATRNGVVMLLSFGECMIGIWYLQCQKSVVLYLRFPKSAHKSLFEAYARV